MKKISLISFFSLAITLWTSMLNAQTLIVTKHGDPVYGYNVSIAGDYYFYQKSEEDDTFIRISKDEVLIIRDNKGNVINVEASTQEGVSTKKEDLSVDRFPEIPLSETHSNPLAYGNCVYIPTDSPYKYERAGQMALKKYLNEEWARMLKEKNIKPYIIVDKPEQAHFVLQYLVHTSGGQDIALLLLRPREYYERRPRIENAFNSNDVGYCLTLLKALKGRSVTFSGRSDMEDPRINVCLGIHVIRYFAGLIGYPDGWKDFWRNYKKNGLFMKPHYGDLEFVNLKGIEDFTEIDEFLKEIE